MRARDDLALDLTRSIMIGDKASDIDAAKAAGVGLKVLLGSTMENSLPDKWVASLHEACSFLQNYR